MILHRAAQSFFYLYCVERDTERFTFEIEIEIELALVLVLEIVLEIFALAVENYVLFFYKLSLF